MSDRLAKWKTLQGPFSYCGGGKKSLLLNQKHTKSFTLLKCSPHGCTGGAVTITNPTAILDSAGLNHLVTAYLLKRTSKTENSTIYYLYFI